VGLRLGRGETLTQIRSTMSAVAEGVLTSRAAHNLAQKLGVSTPILTGIYRVIHGECCYCYPYTMSIRHLSLPNSLSSNTMSVGQRGGGLHLL